MTAPFDWADLARRPSSYIRQRIEAAFVPVERLETQKSLVDWQMARAEAAEAENTRLREFVSKIAEQPCACGVLHHATLCGTCQARQALGGEHE